MLLCAYEFINNELIEIALIVIFTNILLDGKVH